MFIDLQTREDSFWEDVVLKTRRPKDIRLEGKQHYPPSAPSHTSGSWTVLEDQTTEFSCTLSLFIKRFFVKTNSYSVKPLRRIFCKTNNLFNRDCVCYYAGYLVAPSSVDVWSLVEKAGFRCLGLLRISKVLGSLWLVLTVKHHSMFQLFVIWRCSCRHWIICQHGFTRAFFFPLCFLIWNQLNLNGRVGQSWSQTCLAHSSAALTWWVMVPKCGWSPRTWKHLYRCYAELQTDPTLLSNYRRLTVSFVEDYSIWTCIKVKIYATYAALKTQPELGVAYSSSLNHKRSG